MSKLESILSGLAVRDFRIVGNKVILNTYLGNALTRGLVKQMQELPVRYYFNVGVAGDSIPSNTEYVKGDLDLAMRGDLKFKSLECSRFRVAGKHKGTLELGTGKFTDMRLLALKLVNSKVTSDGFYGSSVSVDQSKISSLSYLKLEECILNKTHLIGESSIVMRGCRVEDSIAEAQDLRITEPKKSVNLVYVGYNFYLFSTLYVRDLVVNLSLSVRGSIVIEGALRGAIDFIDAPEVKIGIETLLGNTDLKLKGLVGTLIVFISKSEIPVGHHLPSLNYRDSLRKKLLLNHPDLVIKGLKLLCV